MEENKLKVVFSKKYNYAPYLNVDIGVESQSEHNKESFFSELDKLQSWANEWFKTRYGEYEEQSGTIEKIEPLHKEEVKQSLPKTTEERILALIDSAVTKKEMEVYRKSVDNNCEKYPSLRKAFDDKIGNLKQ